MAAFPCHSGELEMQVKTGEEIPIHRNARIRVARIKVPYLSAGAEKHNKGQPVMIVSSRDAKGRIWTSVLSGRDAYVRVSEEETIELDRSFFTPALWTAFEKILRKY
jgi:hypothetical protein